MELEQRVTNLIANHLGVPAGDVTREASLLDDLTDSLTVVELMMTMEEEFDMEIADEDAAKLNTVGDVIDYLQGHAS